MTFRERGHTSTVALAGLVTRFYEATYFGVVFDRPYPHPIPTVEASFRNLDYLWVPADEISTDGMEGYRAACDHADATIQALDADDVGRVPWWGSESVPLFNVMAHMLGETRQHLGQMDLIREQLDGRVGADVETPTADQRAEFALLWKRSEEAARLVRGVTTS